MTESQASPEAAARDASADDAEAKRRLLAALMRRRAEGPRDRPLSPGQERLWRLARLSPDSPLYNVAVAYRLDGALDATTLGRAVRAIEARHAVLRTTFAETADGPVQRVAPAGAEGATFVERDMSTEPDSAVAAAVAAEAGRIADLGAGPLWRVALLRRGPDAHVLALTMHHIVTDGWSFELFLRELGALYGAFAAGGGDPLPPLPLQYADIAERQRAALEGPEADAARAYWAARLEGPIPALALPVDHPDAGLDRAAATQPFALSAARTEALGALAQREGASLFIVALAGFAALLGRVTGQADLLLCTPVAGRHRARSRELIGYFNNILPIRLDLAGDPSLGEALARVRAAALGAFKHQDTPFQWMADRPALRRIALSRLLFSVDMPWPPTLALEGLRCAPLPVETGAADFDLSVSLWVADGRLQGTLRYKRALFDASTVAALAEGYAETLDRLVDAPETVVSALTPAATPAAASADAREASAGDASLPRFPLELRVAQIWEAVFDRRPMGLDDSLQRLGASSLAVATLAERVQAEFGVELPLTAIFQAGTVAGMAALLQAQSAGARRSPLAPIRAEGRRPPLFLCEGVGVYYALAEALGPDQPVYGLVTDIGGAHPDVEALAAHYLEAVIETQPEGPYFLGGLSFGGVVAFEMAQQLIADGREVALLALFDTPGPGAYRPKPWLPRLLGHVGNVRRYGAPYLKAKLAPRLRRLGRRRDRGEGGAALLRDTDRLRRLFTTSAAGYSIGAYPGRVTLFKLAHRDGMGDSLFDPALGDVDPLLGWGSVAAGGVEAHEIAGEHVSILQEPYVGPLAERLGRRLAAAQGAAAAR